MQEIINNLALKIKNKTISLRDFSDILVEEKIDNSIKFISLLSENNDINNYLASFFNNSKYTEEEIIKKYGEIDGNILVSYAIIKNLIQEEIIDYEDIDVKGLSSLNLFFKDINDLPILSKEDTLKYIKRYQESKKLGKENLCEYYRNLVIEGNIRLIVYVAKSFVSPDMPLTDLINEGFFGINVAIDYYDFNFGCAFSTYATFWIREKIMRSIQNNGRSIRIPVSVQMKYNKYQLIRKELSNKLGRNATNEEVAIAMGENIQNIEKLIQYFNDIMSLDSKLSDDTETDKYNFIESRSSSFEEDVINKETILKLMSCLTEKEKDVIIRRYIQDYTLEAVGKMYGITKERVRQIENKALLKMRNYSKTKVVKADKNEEKLILDGKTLNEILGLSYEDTVYFVSTLDKASQTYNMIINVFGIDVKRHLEKDKLENEVYTKLLSNLNTVKKIINGNNVYKNKYLNDIVSIDLNKIKTYVNKEELVILKKAFGENLDRRFINTVSVKVLTKVINNLNKQIKEEVKMESKTKTNKGKKSMYENMTLDEILDISYEELLDIFNETKKETKNYKIFAKAFGEDFKGIFNTSNLDDIEKISLYTKINSLKKAINNPNGKKNMYKNMTLDMILGISYEEVLDIFNETKKETKTYKIFAKAFGEDFKGTFDLSKLEHNERVMLYNKINRLKKKFLGNLENKKLTKKENNDLNKYYMTIISLMPKEYKTILSLYFENYSLDKIASLMDLDINDVNNRLKEGILFMEKIISLYNKTFDEKIPENEKMLR